MTCGKFEYVHQKCATFLALCILPIIVNSTELPLVSFKDIDKKFVGAFKVQHTDKVSRTSYSGGRMALNATKDGLFFSSHAYQDAIAEFSIPDIIKSNTPDKLQTAPVIQNFTQVHLRAPTGNPDGLESVGGMSVIDNMLFIQYYVGYDAAGKTSDTTLIVEEPTKLATSPVRGFFKMAGAARVVNYMSKIPNEWQDKLAGTYLAGNGDGMSIVSRLSNGPSLYSFSPSDFTGKTRHIKTTRWLDYPVSSPLGSYVHLIPKNIEQVKGYRTDWDAFNLSGQNDVWTESSAAWFGFIIPKTRTFAAIGQQGMHRFGGGYKIKQDNGRECSGPCPHKASDWDTYYWLFDLDDIIQAKRPERLMPYEYGVFDNRFLNTSGAEVTGLPSSGAWDASTKTLYICYANGAGTDKTAAHIVALYRLN